MGLALVDMDRASERIAAALNIRPLTQPGRVEIDVTQDDLPYDEMIAAIRPEQLRRDIETLAAFGSRVPGTAGHKRAGAFIEKRLRELFGDRVVVEPFELPMPVYGSASLQAIDSETAIPLYGLWPNHVKPNTVGAGGVRGEVVYCGKGEYEDYSGIDMMGKLVVLDYDSDLNFIKARKLGAAAIVFIPRGRVNSRQSEVKWLDQPVDIPRFYVDGKDMERLLALAGKRASAQLTAEMSWRKVECRNIYVRLDGASGSMPNVKTANGAAKAWADGAMVIAAHYDSMSVTPQRSPGAEDACGIAAMLEFARVLAANPDYANRRPLIFLAIDAHYQGLSGAADFLRKHYTREPNWFKKYMDFDLYRTQRKGGVFAPVPFDLWVSLDLSSHGDGVAAMVSQMLMQYDINALSSVLAPISLEFEKYAEQLWGDAPRFFNGINSKKRAGGDYLGRSLAFDTEMCYGFGQLGFTLATTNDLRERGQTPLDLPEHINWDGLTQQVRTVAGLLMRASRDEGPSKAAGATQPITGDIYGTVVWFDPAESFFVPAAPVYKPDAPSGPGRAAGPPLVVYQGMTTGKSAGGVRGMLVAMAEKPDVPVGALNRTDKEQFFFPAVRMAGEYRGSKLEYRAYAFDRDGRIVFATDMGQQGTVSYPNKAKSGGVQIVAFPCRAFTILDAIDPRYLVALDEAFVYLPNAAEPQCWSLDTADTRSSETSVYGNTASLASVVYMEPGRRFKFAAGVSLLGPKYLLLGVPDELLTNPLTSKTLTKENREKARGSGYAIEGGVLRFPQYKAARDMWVLDDMWLKTMSKYNIRNERLLKLHDSSLLKKKTEAVSDAHDARAALLSARDAIDKRDYARYARSINAALGLEARAYPEVLSSANDTVKGIIFYFALLIPFSFFMERLLFGFPDIRYRIAGFSGVFLVVFFLLKLVHPAFRLTRSPYVVLLAFIILALAGIVMVIIVGKFGAEMRKMRIESQGMYESDVGRLSATSAAIMLGIANLRRRPLRTFLTAAAIVLLTFTVISFTSVKTSVEFFRLPRNARAVYEGALLRTRDVTPMYPVVLEHVDRAFGDGAADVVPRYWIFRRFMRYRFIDVLRSGDSGRTYVSAILGAGVREPELLPVADTLLGRSRWFRPDETDVCLVSDLTARNLGFSPDDLGQGLEPVYVTTMGKRLRVVGIFDSKKMDRIRDLDGESFMPSEPDISPSQMYEKNILASEYSFSQDIKPVDRLEAQAVMICPNTLVRSMGGQLICVALHSRTDEKQFIARVKQFLSRVGIIMFVSEENRVVAYSSYGTTNMQGLKNLFVPLLIAALIVLNVMLGAVAERSNEIGIYSSVGLAPTHIGALFMAESWVFATVGAVFGYLLGQSVAKIVMITPWMKGITLNYSSFSAVNCTIVVMVTVFLSTMYPAKVAANKAVPDVSRRWKLPDPVGDLWVFDFPFTVGGDDITGLYQFLGHYFSSYTENSVGDFYAEDVRLDRLDGQDGRAYRVSLTAWVAPFDLGISQRVSLDAVDTGEHNVYRVEVRIERLSGDSASWRRMNRGFLDMLRKRFLVWRTVPKGLKDTFRREGDERLGVNAPVSTERSKP